MLFLKKRRKLLLCASCILLALLLLFAGCAIYVSDYYPADEGAIEAFLAHGQVEERQLEGGIAYGPSDAEVGFIFYPGGKVDHTAYIPLMRALAARGVLCVLLEMPFRLAVLDINAASGIREQFPSISRWYIGGHSLGGSMAASHLAEHAGEYRGLILLGSYATVDLSQSGLSVLCVYGSEDRVMDREKYEKNRVNLPSDMTETVLEGGCHAYFGMYGPQEGDGTPTLTCKEQITLTAEAVLELMARDTL